jgi:hypothetical protein
MALGIVARLCWILRELCLCFCRILSEIEPYLVFLLEVDLDLSRIAWNLLALEFRPRETLDERIICPRQVIHLTLAGVERFLVLARLWHWDSVCRWLHETEVCRIWNEKPFIFDFNSFTVKRIRLYNWKFQMI